MVRDMSLARGGLFLMLQAAFVTAAGVPSLVTNRVSGTHASLTVTLESFSVLPLEVTWCQNGPDGIQSDACVSGSAALAAPSGVAPFRHVFNLTDLEPATEYFVASRLRGGPYGRAIGMKTKPADPIWEGSTRRDLGWGDGGDGYGGYGGYGGGWGDDGWGNPPPPPPVSATTHGHPPAWDFESMHPQCNLTVLNQGKCNSCTAFAAASVMSDRFCINYHKPSPVLNTILSPQDVIDCSNEPDMCQAGADPMQTFESMHTVGVRTCSSDDNCHTGCVPLLANPGYCSYQCASQGATSTRYYIESAYLVLQDTGSLEQEVRTMQDELMENGPFQANFAPTGAFMVFFNSHSQDCANARKAAGITTQPGDANHVYNNAVFTKLSSVSCFGKLSSECDTLGHTFGQHAIKITGWGSDQSSALYWTIQNSWGSNWNTNGFGKVSSEMMYNNNQWADMIAAKPRQQAAYSQPQYYQQYYRRTDDDVTTVQLALKQVTRAPFHPGAWHPCSLQKAALSICTAAGQQFDISKPLLGQVARAVVQVNSVMCRLEGDSVRLKALCVLTADAIAGRRSATVAQHEVEVSSNVNLGSDSHTLLSIGRTTDEPPVDDNDDSSPWIVSTIVLGCTVAIMAVTMLIMMKSRAQNEMPADNRHHAENDVLDADLDGVIAPMTIEISSVRSV